MEDGLENKTQVSLSKIEEIRSIPRGFGSYGDMVLFLMMGLKLKWNHYSISRKAKFIEENIIKNKSSKS